MDTGTNNPIPVPSTNIPVDQTKPNGQKSLLIVLLILVFFLILLGAGFYFFMKHKQTPIDINL